MTRAPRRFVFALLLAGAFACRRPAPESVAPDSGAPTVPAGPIRVENLIGLELTLPAPWAQTKGEPNDLAEGIFLRARRPSPAGGLAVAPSLVVERPSANEVEDVVALALRSLEALEANAGVELQKTSSGLNTLGGRSFRALEASYRLGPTGKTGVFLVQRSFFLGVPDAPAGARVLGFHFTHLAEDAEALGTELDVVLSGIALTGPRLTVPGEPSEPSEPEGEAPRGEK